MQLPQMPHFSHKQILHGTVAAFIRWLFLAVLVGSIGGLAVSVLRAVLEWATLTRMAHSWLILLLPIGGIFSALMYRHAHNNDIKRGNDMVLAAIREEKEVPAITAPLIFVAATITHLLGGSVGRVGASIQLSGSLASLFSRLFHFDQDDRHVFIMSGVAGGLGAVFGAPISAAIFVLEVVSVGEMCYAALIPCIVAALTGYEMSLLLHQPPMFHAIPQLSTQPQTFLSVLALGALVALVAIAYCRAIKETTAFLYTRIPNSVYRIVLGGSIIVLLTVLLGHTRYNGGGTAYLMQALSGQAEWYDFILKLIFTAITLGAGYKGGEIAPAFFVGATFGCVVGPLLGLSADAAAALAMIGLFCGITNCPLASIMLGVEVFGGSGIMHYALVCSTAYMLSGYYSLYGEQQFIFAKTKALHLEHPEAPEQE